MPSNLTFPGVYIEEIPSGVRTIVGVATSITAFFGMALRGPNDDPVVINSYGDFERTFGGLWVDSSLGYAVRDFYLNGGSQAIIVRLHRNATPADITIGGLLLAAANPGKWGNNLSVTIDHNTKDPANNKLFNMQVVEVDPVTQQALRVENMLNVSVDPADARFVPLVVRDDSQLIVVKKDNLGNWSVPAARPAPGTTKATAASGSDGVAIDQSSFVGGTLETDKRGLFALEKADLFNLLCIPPYRADGNVDVPLIEQASVYCEKKRAMLLIDPPAAWDTVAEVITGLPNTGPTSKNAAIFFPRLRQPNPLRENKLEDFVPCGAVAGIFARTDAQRGVWKAPAGLDATLVGVPQLTVSLTNDENGQLNPLGVNCLRTMPAVGRVVWGSRTLPWQRSAGFRVEVRSGATHGVVHRRELYRGTAVGRVRTERRTALGANPTQRRRVYEFAVSTGSVPGPVAARSVLRQVRQRHHHAERHRSRHRQHPGRFCTVEAG